MSRTHIRHYKQEFGEIVENFGEDVALRILEAKRGCRVTIPPSDHLRREGTGHWLVQAVGFEKAMEICKHFQVAFYSPLSEKLRLRGAQIELPAFDPERQEREYKLISLINSGLGADHIAHTLGISRRTIYRKKKKYNLTDNKTRNQLRPNDSSSRDHIEEAAENHYRAAQSYRNKARKVYR